MRRDAVLVCGGRWHDFDHARRELLAGLGEMEEVRTRVFEDYARVDALDRAELLVSYTCDVRPSVSEQKALAGWVAAGGRWLALHGTNAAIDPPVPPSKRYTTPAALGRLPAVLGSRFLGHPPIEPYTVEVAAPEHPFVVGLEPFVVRDELYISELHPPLEVLLHARYRGECPGFTDAETTDDEARPVLYLKRYGAGAVCYFTLGHCRGRYDIQDLGVDDLGHTDLGSWVIPEFRTVLARCLHWAITGQPPQPTASSSIHRSGKDITL